MTSTIQPPAFKQAFHSTRGNCPPTDLATAVLAGTAPDGGLWVPEHLEPFTTPELEALVEMPFAELATEVAWRLLGTDMQREQLAELITDAFDFDIPLRRIDAAGGGADTRSLELFHGPTLAFKDVGARCMARLLRWARRRQGATDDLTILVATSGDTGSAVAQAFLGLEGFRVVVLFPHGQVSEAQRKLFTTLGQNTAAFCVDGSFDDCQRLVKTALADRELRQRMALGSANSINVARLLPQALYYFWIKNQLSDADRDRPLVVSVPSGNFGNLTAGLLAKRLGLGIDLFLAATNSNDIVPQFLSGGPFAPRPSVQTVANAMDVGDPSNFERILWLYSGDEQAIRNNIAGARYSDDEVLAAMRALHRQGSLLDPHATIAYLAACENAQKGELDNAVYAFLATAHPAKFADVVRTATGTEIELPAALAEALQRPESVLDLAPDYRAFKRVLVSPQNAA